MSDQGLSQAKFPEHVDHRLHRRLVDDGDRREVHDLPQLQRRAGQGAVGRRRHYGARPRHRVRRRTVVGEQDEGVDADPLHPRLGVGDGQRQVATEDESDEVLRLRRNDDRKSVVIRRLEKFLDLVGRHCYQTCVG